MRCLSTFSGCGWAYGFTAHTVTTANGSPDLCEFGEILPDASVQTMPLHLVEAE
jgi:hypothetical protein